MIFIQWNTFTIVIISLVFFNHKTISVHAINDKTMEQTAGNFKLLILI